MMRTSRSRRLARRRVRTVACFLNLPRTSDLRTLTSWYDAVNGHLDMGWTPEAIIENIGGFHAQVLVTEVIGDGHDYRNVMVGAHWRSMHCGDVTGTLLSQYPNFEVRQKTRILFNQIINTRRALFIDTPPIAARRVHRSQGLEMAFMPLRGRDGKVTHLITAVPHHQLVLGTR